MNIKNINKRIVKLFRYNLLLKLVRFNLKIIFAGKFVWFILAALVLFCLFMYQAVWNQDEISEGLVYNLLMFPSMLLIFYPSVFGIQNDEDARILEILFGIPDYKYKVWGFRLLMIYVAIFLILILFCYVANILLYQVNPLEMSAQMMVPILFYGNLAFLMSTLTRSGNGTAVVMIIFTIVFLMFTSSNNAARSFWNIRLNPFQPPTNMLPVVWHSLLIKNRLFLIIGSLVWALLGLLNLQKREKFV